MKAPILFLFSVFTPVTLADCDRAWKARGVQPPRFAIVINVQQRVRHKEIGLLHMWKAECRGLSIQAVNRK